MRRLLFCAAAWICMAGIPGSIEAQPVIKLATVLPKGTSYHQILQTMGAEWRKAPNGGVGLTIFTDSTMGDESDIVRRMRVGQLQAAMLSTIGLADIDKSVTALQYMPMMFRSLEEFDAVKGKLRPKLENTLLQRGYVVLFWSDAGWVRFFSKEPAMGPADFKKFKMFVWAGDNFQVDLMKALGYQPVPLVSGDIRPGLQTGMINAIALAPFYALASQVHDAAPNMLELNWVPLVGAAVVSKTVWEKLPADTREAMLGAAHRAGEQMQAKGRSEAAQSVEAMKKRGLKVHAVTPELENAWRQMAEGVYPKIRGGVVPTETFDEVQTYLKQHRASAPKPAR